MTTAVEIRDTAIANELDISSMLRDTSSMVLHPRTSSYVSKNKNLNVNPAG